MAIKMQTNLLKKKLKKFLRSRKIVKFRRKLADLEKKLISLIQKKKLEIVAEQELETIVGPRKSKGFISVNRILAFAILFISIGGSYFWFRVADQQVPLKVVENKADEGAPLNGVKITRLVDQDKAITRALSEPGAFTLQPYIKSDISISLVRTINPHFFIQAAKDQQLKVAILVVGLGINQSLTDEIIEEAPKNISLVFSPYTPLLQSEVKSAQIEGFTVLVSIPLEDEDLTTDQGYLTISARVNDETNQANLKRIISNSQGADCFYGQGGARLLRSESALQPAFSYLKEANNCFVAPPDILVNRLHAVAANINLNYVCTTIVNPSEDLMLAVESLTKRTGFAIVAFDAKPGVLEEIKQWIKNLDQAKISVVPITEIIHS